MYLQVKIKSPIIDQKTGLTKDVVSIIYPTGAPWLKTQPKRKPSPIPPGLELRRKKRPAGHNQKKVLSKNRNKKKQPRIIR